MKVEGLAKIFLFSGALLFTYPYNVKCNKAWTSEPRVDNQFWKTRHAANVKIVESNINGTNSINAIFIGDSITDLWIYDGFGKEIWNKEYLPKGAVNFGISGDQTQHVLWRIENGKLNELQNPPPKLIVLCIGTNNIGFYNSTDDDIVKGVEKIVHKLRTDLPKTKIILLGLFPRQTIWHFIRVANINLKMARLDPDTYENVNGTLEYTLENRNMVRFLDMWTHFAKSMGEVVPELFNPDLLHINAAGYAKWAHVMNSTFMEFFL